MDGRAIWHWNDITWGGIQGGGATGIGGPNRANLTRLGYSYEELLKEAEKSPDEVDKDDEESLIVRNREDLVNILIGLAIAAVLIGLIALVAFVIH